MKTLYKTLKTGLKSEHGNFKWEKNKWYKTDGKISLCNNGFHASKRIIDAMDYVTPDYIALVEVRGKNDKQADKECWEEMRIIKTKKWTKKHSVMLSIFAAELCIKNFEKIYPNDDRPRKAIEAAKKWIKNPTIKNKSAAASAAASAWSAAASAWSVAASASSAARSARSAARSAASVAASAASAWSAAWSAARSAAWSAGSVEKTLNKCEKYIKEIIIIK